MSTSSKKARRSEPVTVIEERQRRNYGGFNIGAAFYGWLVATGVGAIVTALLAAAGSAVALSSGNINSKNTAGALATVGIISGILLLLSGAISYFMGGYVAGRMSRFDGGRQGFGVWLMGILSVVLLAAVGAGFGAKYNVLQQLNLPHIPIDQGTITTAGLITLVASLVVTFLAAISGGKIGERYHRKIDRAGEVRTLRTD